MVVGLEMILLAIVDASFLWSASDCLKSLTTVSSCSGSESEDEEDAVVGGSGLFGRGNCLWEWRLLSLEVDLAVFAAVNRADCASATEFSVSPLVMLDSLACLFIQALVA